MGDDSSEDSRRTSWIRTNTVAVVMIVVAAVVFILVAAVILSPAMSPLASIHDADGDGYADSVDAFPNDQLEWSDMDDDGWGDNTDDFPHDGEEHLDSDDDGVGDNTDPFPDDPSEWSDMDDDGWGDNVDDFPHDAEEYCDSDDDGVGDNADAFPDDPTETMDTDGDGVGDNTDLFPVDPFRDAPWILLSTDISNDEFVWMEFTFVYPEFAWDNLRISISDGSDTVTWEPISADLEGGDTTHGYGSEALGDLDVFLTVTDERRDGIVGLMDTLTIGVDGGVFEAGVWYTVNLTYEPTGSEMDAFDFERSIETPSSALTKTAVTGGYKFSFVNPSSEAAWDDVTILLNDGANSVSWTPTSDNLDDGPGDIYHYTNGTLGALTVGLTIMDLVGNGMVDGGDYFTLTAEFSPVTDYTVYIIYEPTDGVMATITFSG